MGKKYRSKRQSITSLPFFAFFYRHSAPLLSILFFFAVCLSYEDAIKRTAMVLILLALTCGALRFSALRDRVTPPLIALALLVLMDGISISYAVSMKFALYEFLQVLNAFCLALLLLALAKGEGAEPGRWIATVLEGSAALAGLVSIDLISTRLISTPVLSLLERFTAGYANLAVLTPGSRILSLYTNPNLFASVVGLGVLLSLGLALSAKGGWERVFHLVCLFINALSFVLAFSMGASATIAVAFLLYLLLERKGRRGGLFLLMAETLILTICAAMLISTTSFQAWTEPRPIPLLSTIGGAAALCLLDRLVGQRLVEKLRGSKVLLFLIGAVFALLAAYIPTALFWTEGTVLQAGESLRRAAYPDPGEYTLEAETDSPVKVSVSSQNLQMIMMGTADTLYSGSLSEAAFSVPEDSLVVYFSFYSAEPARIDSVIYTGENGSGSIPLEYKLLPGFIAYRIQGLRTSTTAIQRLVIFSDGLRLFQRSPIIGLGLGSFENGIKSVQSFFYETQYAHNHYIQSLIDTGVVGLALFVGLIALSAAAVLLSRRKEDAHPLTPALGAALAFMAGHAATELIFSAHCYLPMAFGVFALIGLCCGGSLPSVGRWVRGGVLLAIAASLCVFAVLLGENMQAAVGFQKNPTFRGLEMAAKRDKFEWADYMLAYVTNSTNSSLDVDDSIRRQADVYAERLSQLDSNIVPLRLAEYYLRTGRIERGLEMAEKYVNYVSSDKTAWQQTFDLLEWYETDSDVYRAGVARIARMMETWNEENIGKVSVDDESMAFIARMEGRDPEISG